MFYSNDPVKDYEDYQNYLEKENEEWHKNNDWKLEKELEELKIKKEELEEELNDIENKLEDLDFEIEKISNQLNN